MYKNIGICTFVQAHSICSINIELPTYSYSLTHRLFADNSCPPRALHVQVLPSLPLRKEGFWEGI